MHHNSLPKGEQWYLHTNELVWCTTECRWEITYTTGIKHKSSISGDNFIWMAYAFIILYGIIPTSITGFFN